jgi:trigger factor
VPPPIIDQRVGREEVLNHAVSESLDKFYREAVTETQIRVLGRPEADVVGWPDVKDFSGDLTIAVEVDVRPDFDLPDYEGIELTVDTVEISDDEVDEELANLRTRFGTLVTVDRPATTGDFAQIDLTATIGDDEVDTAKGISYELGSGELIEGIDEALESLTAGESTTFESKLLGGDREGETALIAVTVTAVKERELPRQTTTSLRSPASSTPSTSSSRICASSSRSRSRSARAARLATRSSRSSSSRSRSPSPRSSSKTRSTVTSSRRTASRTTSTAPR